MSYPAAEALPTYDELHNQVNILQQENELLKFQLEQLKKYVYGSRGEKRTFESPDQERLFADEASSESVPDTVEVAPYQRKVRGKKRALSEDIPTERHEYFPDKTHCPSCNTELQRIGEEVREELEYIPAVFLKKEHVKVKCACPKCSEGVYQGELPVESQPVIEKCPAGPGLLSHIIVSKFSDHLPLYRQERIFARQGVVLERKRLCEWSGRVAELLTFIGTMARDEILQSGYVQADETPLKVQDPSVEGRTHQGRLWVLRSPEKELCYFQYHPSRSTEAAKELIDENYNQFIQSDGYAVYSSLPNVTRLGCLAHARRKFIEARSLSPPDADRVIRLIAELYRIEQRIKKKTAAVRLKVRQEKSLVVLKRLKSEIASIPDRFLPQHPLTAAAKYALGQWDTLVRYTEDPRFEIDNNAVERAIRPVAIGRKNWLFAGSHEGAKRAALFFTIIENCKAHKVNPFEYLRDVLSQLHSHSNLKHEELLPQNWKLKYNGS